MDINQTETILQPQRYSPQDVMEIIDGVASLLSRTADPTKRCRHFRQGAGMQYQHGVLVVYEAAGREEIVDFNFVNRDQQEVRVGFDILAAMRIGPPYIAAMLEKIDKGLNEHMRLRFNAMKSLLDIKTVDLDEPAPSAKLDLASSIAKAVSETRH